MGELGLSVETLARETGLATTTVRYFGQAPAHAGTLEAIGAGLGWPPGYLQRILNGESPRPAGPPPTVETPVVASLRPDASAGACCGAWLVMARTTTAACEVLLRRDSPAARAAAEASVADN